MAEASLIAVIAGAIVCWGPFDCNTAFDSSAGIILWIIIMLYMFKALGTICDEYFVPAIDVIVERLKMTPDVAGATFLAAGSSAPELATSTISTFLIVSEGGIGTIIGSAVFNILVIVGITGVVACKRESLPIWWYPLLRDTMFYLIAIGELLIFVLDGKIQWWEGFIMVCTYFTYILYMRINPIVIRKLGLTSSDPVENFGPGQSESENQELRQDGKRTSPSAVAPESGAPVEFCSGVVPTEATAEPARSPSSGPAAPENEAPELPEEDDQPKTFLGRLRSLRDPLSVVLEYTMPSAENHYWLLFNLSIVWICIASFLMVDATARIGHILAIDELVMGLLFLAAGTSIPDALGSIAVAKQGEGDMAVANALGSNVFDILIGLGLPWMLYALAKGSPLVFGDDAYDKFKYDVLVLIAVLLLFVGTLAVCRWKLTRALGIVLIFLYGFYILYALVVRPCVLTGAGLPTKSDCAFD